MAADTNGLMPLITPMTPGLDINANEGPRIIAVAAVLITISTIAVILRFVSRLVSQAGFWWDDWTILAALIVSWSCSIIMIISTGYGFGTHMAAEGSFQAQIDAAFHWFKLFYAFETMYTVAITLTKYSILLFYSRIFKERSFKILLWVTTGLVTVWFLAIEITVLAECQPIAALWDFSPGHCINLASFFQGSGIPNVILNTIILILPLPMIWTLQIERKHKIALSSVFLLGSFVVVVSIVRLIELASIQEVDITWTYVNAGIWTNVEPAIGVCSACLPIMRSLFIRSRYSNDEPQNDVKRSIKSVLSAKSIRSPEKPRVTSFNSNTPLNELSAEGELPWGNHVRIFSTNHAGDDPEIAMEDLPIQREEESASSEGPSYKGGNIWKHMKKKSDVAELYG